MIKPTYKLKYLSLKKIKKKGYKNKSKNKKSMKNQPIRETRYETLRVMTTHKLKIIKFRSKLMIYNKHGALVE